MRNPDLSRSFRGKAVMIERPEPTDNDDFAVTSCDVKRRRVLTYPSPTGSYQPVPAIAQLAGKHSDLGKAYMKSLKRLGYDWRDNYTRVGGYPMWVQDN